MNYNFQEKVQKSSIENVTNQLISKNDISINIFDELANLINSKIQIANNLLSIIVLRSDFAISELSSTYFRTVFI